MQMFVMQRSGTLDAVGGGRGEAGRPRTAMEIITNTHDTSLRKKVTARKRRLSETTRTNIQPRNSIDKPHLSSHSSRIVSKDAGFADQVRSSMLRRGYIDIPEYISKVGIIQSRRKGHYHPNGSAQFYPLQITVPPYSVLCDVEGRFENPRPAPVPKGLKYNTTCNSPSAAKMDITAPLDTTDFSDLTKASIFSLPRFDPDKEMRMLQSLWSKRVTFGVTPLIHRASGQVRPSSQGIDKAPQERSFFESDSDDEDEEHSMRKIWKVRRRSGRRSFSAIRRALIGSDKFGLREFPNIEVIPIDNWRKMFSLCDQEGERLLILETTSENTILVAGSIAGIAYELFRTHDDETKRFIVRSHTVYTTTNQILDTIQSCLLKNESKSYWQSVELAAMRIIETLCLWQEIQPQDFNQTMRRQQLLDIVDWCDDHSADDIEEICDSLRDSFSINFTPLPRSIFWIAKPISVEIPEENERTLLNIRPWELVQYLGIYDYLYVEHMLSKCPLDDLLSSIAADEPAISSGPDLRSEQLQYWITLEILNSPSMAVRVRWICLFIETAMALFELSDYFSSFLIADALCSSEVQSLEGTWKKIPVDQMNKLHSLSETAQAPQSWATHRDHLQRQRRSCVPYLPCIIRELRNINASQPSNVGFYDNGLCATDEPVLIPTSPGTGMINLRKFRSMYDLLCDATNFLESPCSFWYRMFPDDPQFPGAPKLEQADLTRFEGIKRLVENEIEDCWTRDSVVGNWERSLHIKKILASAGF